MFPNPILSLLISFQFTITKLLIWTVPFISDLICSKKNEELKDQLEYQKEEMNTLKVTSKNAT